MKRRILIWMIMAMAMTMAACGEAADTSTTKTPVKNENVDNHKNTPAVTQPEATPATQPEDDKTDEQAGPTAAQIETQRRANQLMRDKVGGNLKNKFDFFDLNHDDIYEYYVQMDMGRKDRTTFNDLLIYVEDETGKGSLKSMTGTQYGLGSIGFDKKRTLLIQEYTEADSYSKYRYYFLDAYGDDAYLPHPFKGQSMVYADTTVGLYILEHPDGSTTEISMKSEEGLAISDTIREYTYKPAYSPDMNFAGTDQNCEVYLPLDDEHIIGLWESRTKWNK